MNRAYSKEKNERQRSPIERRSRSRSSEGVVIFSIPPVRVLKELSVKLKRVLHLAPAKKGSSNEGSDPNSSNLLAFRLDSHATEAVEDCIKYINSSSSPLPRSVSVSGSTIRISGRNYSLS